VGSWRLTRACLVVSVGSVSACPLIVGPSVELLCCSTSGSWDSNTPSQANEMLGIVYYIGNKFDDTEGCNGWIVILHRNGLHRQ
jgi:hypothetical protein